MVNSELEVSINKQFKLIKKINIIQVALILTLIFLIVIYLFTPNYFYINLLMFFLFIGIVFVCVGFYLLILIGASKHPFALSSLFILSYFIVFFQKPIDLALGNYDPGHINIYFYNQDLILKQVLYSVIFLGFFVLGASKKAKSFNKNISKEKQLESTRKVMPEKIFFYCFYLFFILHLVTIDPTYYLGLNKGDPEGIAGSILGYFLRTLPVCFGVIIYNAKVKADDYNLKKFFGLFPFFFIIIIFLFSAGTFIAGDRGPAIRTLILFVFSYFIISKHKVSYLVFFAAIYFAGYFLSIIKLMGAIDFRSIDFFSEFSMALDRFGETHKAESVMPFTSELSGSIRSYSIAFSLWSEGVSFNGISALTGVLMAVPFGVTALMLIFNLTKEDINVSYFITAAAQESYGLGNTIVGDVLLNLGFLGGGLVAYLLGSFFMRVDISFYKNISNVFIYGVGCYFLMSSVGLTRGSIFPLIGNAIFIIVYMYLLIGLSKLLINKFRV